MTNRGVDPTLSVETRSATRRLLIASTAGEPVPSDVDVDRLPAKWLYEAATNHRIAPALMRTLRLRDDVPEPLRTALEHSAQQQRIEHLRSLSELAHLQDVLQRVGVRWAVAKGPVAAAHLWPAADMRQYTDIDLYVAPADFPRAVEALVASGCVEIDRNWPEMVNQMRAEFAMRGPQGSMIDLHWHIAVRPELRRAFAIDIDDMLDRVRPVQLGNGTYPTFDTADGALLLAFHAAMSGGNRLMWLGDLWYATRESGFSWSELERRARATRVTLPVSLMCARMTALLDASDVHSALLKPRGVWSLVSRLSARRASGVFLPGDPHADGGVIASARPTFAASVLAGLGDRWTVSRGQKGVRHGVPVVNLLDDEVPDPAARKRYFDKVVRAGR